MTAQVHAAPSPLHSFPTSSFSSSANSPAATPSSEREFVFDSLAGLSARFDVKSKAAQAATSPALSSAPEPAPAPPQAETLPGPSSTQQQVSRPMEAIGVAQRPDNVDKTVSADQPRASSARTHRPRLKSLQSLNAAPASPTLSEPNSGETQLLTSSATFSRPGLPMGGSAIERLQPLAAAGASASGSAQRLGSSTSVSRTTSRPARLTAHNATDAPAQPAEGSRSPRSGAAAPKALRNEYEYTEFGAFASGSMASAGLESERMAAAARARTQSAHALAGPGLKRNNTTSAGFELLSLMDPGPNAIRSGNSSTFGFASAAAGRSRQAPRLGARRQTVSNIHANDFDHLLSGQGRTMGYSQQQQQQQQHHNSGPTSSSLLTSPQSHNHIRERAVLQSNQLEAKVVILGTQGVGKTSLVHRYTSGQFSASSIPSTIGASFLTKKLIVDGVKVRLQLWDTAGQERFRSMAPMYYRGSNAAVIVYDITSMQSFMDVKSWIEELRRNMASDLVIHIVGAKLDLAYAKRDVALDFARSTVRSWIKSSVTPPDSPDLSQSLSPSKSTSRLGGLGNLTIGSASRLASFPRGQQIPSGGHAAAASANKAGSAGSSAASGGSERGHDAFSDGGLFSSSPDSSGFPSWEQIEVSEVSAKDDEGIEDVFLAITKKLVERRAVIEQERLVRERNSIILSESSFDHGSGGGGGPNDRGLAGQGEASWGCCT